LMRQIKVLGQITPIIVSKKGKKYVCHDGHHRIEAHVRVGRSKIKAFLFQGTKLQLMLAQLATDDNLKHSYVYRSELLKKVVEQWKSERADEPGPKKAGRPEGDIARAACSLPLGGTKTGRIKRIQRAYKIAELPDEVKILAQQLGLDRNQAALEKVAAENTPEAQLARLEERAKLLRRQKLERKKIANTTAKHAVLKNENFDDNNSEAVFEALKSACTKAFRELWNKAEFEVRKRFLSEVLKWKGAHQDDNEDWDC
jgi:ParB-like nuclease family protein